MATNFPTSGPWFVNIMRGEYLNLVILKNCYFGISTLTLSELQNTWYLECKSSGRSDKVNIEKLQYQCWYVFVGD